MLAKELNEVITRTGPDTKMGGVFRRYWLPALLSEEVPEADCPPVRVRMLGEDLVAYRDSTGQVGLVGAFCPHRRAPMFFARNEEAGLRCVYHGWKFDVGGNCVDLPSEPPGSVFKQKVNIAAYPTWEGGGLVWAYLGPRAEIPPTPDYEWLRAPATHQRVSKTLENANYMQALEGGIDTAHSSFVHNNDMDNARRLKSIDVHPTLEVERTDYGFRYAGIRNVAHDRQYVRAYQFFAPNMQMRARVIDENGDPRSIPTLRGHIWVPIDDEWTMVYNWVCSTDPNAPMSDEAWARHEKSAGRGPDDFIPGTYRLKSNLSNDYYVDRELQRTKTYTGIKGLNTQDFAVQEGMGPIVDRSLEHLGTSDRAIIVARRMLLEAVDRVAEGLQPPGVDPDSYRDVRAAEALIKNDERWQDAMSDLLVAEW
ncbi:MAG: Rieske 2Fe-2S domain-containing protein [Actinomycetota bacterium]|nr:Rieske 2Fe-2S domain-containing protein [Actinomycetota bacterium]